MYAMQLLSETLYIYCSVELGPEDLPKKNDISPVLRIMSLGHSLVAFVNGEFIGKNTEIHRGSASSPINVFGFIQFHACMAKYYIYVLYEKLKLVLIFG